MGSACGCVSKEGEDEITAVPNNDINLVKKFPFTDLSPECMSGRIAVPMVDLEKEFEKMLSDLAIQNPVVNVLAPSHRGS